MEYRICSSVDFLWKLTLYLCSDQACLVHTRNFMLPAMTINFKESCILLATRITIVDARSFFKCSSFSFIVCYIFLPLFEESRKNFDYLNSISVIQFKKIGFYCQKKCCFLKYRLKSIIPFPTKETIFNPCLHKLLRELFYLLCSFSYEKYFLVLKYLKLKGKKVRGKESS